jgi:hypothetical protein
VDAAGIRGTILSAQSRLTTNGYELIALHPIPSGHYLLLVRDRRDPQWRASGYFTAGTNGDPVHLQVDSKGMMRSGQARIAMPEVKFLPEVIEPEFKAGWGEDSDGDGLPDIYEALVTATDPTKADTGDTGVLDGYKEMSNDGWSNLEKFRRRADPLKAVTAPAAVALTRPTMAEVAQAIRPQTDLPYQPQVEMRVAGTANFQRIQPNQDPFQAGNFDLRVSWVIPEPQTRVTGYLP